MTNLTIGCSSYLLLLLLLIQFTSGLGLEPESTERVHCVYIHGAGTAKSNPGSPPVHRDIDNLPQPLKDYWGNVKQWAEDRGDDRDNMINEMKKLWKQYPQSEPDEYSRNIEEKLNELRPVTPPCTSYAFTYLNTVDNGWKEEHLAKAACEALQHGEDEKSITIRIFLHSMGNLIFFNALYLNKCEINKNNTNVYSLGGPILGSDMVTAAEKLCNANVKCQTCRRFAKLTGVSDKLDMAFNARWGPICADIKDEICGKFSEFFRSESFRENFDTICNNKTGELTASFASLGHLDLDRNKHIIALAEEYTTGAICGSEIDHKNVLYKFVARFGKKVHGSHRHDGVVHIDSCKAVNQRANWGRSNKNDFWIASKDHSAITGRGGDLDVFQWLKTRA